MIMLTVLSGFFFFLLFNNNQNTPIKFNVEINSEQREHIKNCFQPHNAIFSVLLTNLDDKPLCVRTLVTEVYIDDKRIQTMVWPSRRSIVSCSHEGVSENVFFGERGFVAVPVEYLVEGNRTITAKSYLYNRPFIFWGNPISEHVVSLKIFIDATGMVYACACPEVLDDLENPGSVTENGTTEIIDRLPRD